MPEENYRNKLSEGLTRSYYEYGQLKSVENYKNGQPDRVFRLYDENGSLLKKEKYKDSASKTTSQRHKFLKVLDWKVFEWRKKSEKFSKAKRKCPNLKVFLFKKKF